MNNETKKPETVLIAGASRGIGLALAEQFSHHGHEIVLVSSNAQALNKAADELKRAYGVKVRVYACDLSRPESPQALFDELVSDSIKVDILVNNAGIGSYGPFAESDSQRDLSMMQLNMVGLTLMTRLFLPSMLSRGQGRIMNVASLSGYQPGGPGMAVYFATKAYVLSFTRALSAELCCTGVTATALCPGPTSTAFKSRDGLENTWLYRLFQMPAEAVAKAGYRGVMAGKRAVIPGFANKFLAFAGELPPRRIALEVNRLLLKGTSKNALFL